MAENGNVSWGEYQHQTERLHEQLAMWAALKVYLTTEMAHTRDDYADVLADVLAEISRLESEAADAES